MLISIFLPIALAIIMFSLGLGLTPGDFTRIFRRPKAFAVGALAQIIILPIVAYALAILFRLPAELAVGLMILSLCPSGVTSNILTKIAHGDLALSISLTGIFSLTSVTTVPFLTRFFAEHFLGMEAPTIRVGALGISMFVITVAPVIAGMLVRRYASRLALAAEKPVSALATILFVIVVIGAIAANWRLLVDNLAVLGPSVVVLNAVLLAIGLLLGRIFSLSWRESTSVAIETGIQNATLGITVGTLIVEQAQGLPPFSLPSGVYGVSMYVVSIPFVLWRRRTAPADARAA
jgi:Predicted Na+-dependent transporter